MLLYLIIFSAQTKIYRSVTTALTLLDFVAPSKPSPAPLVAGASTQPSSDGDTKRLDFLDSKLKTSLLWQSEG